MKRKFIKEIRPRLGQCGNFLDCIFFWEIVSYRIVAVNLGEYTLATFKAEPYAHCTAAGTKSFI